MTNLNHLNIKILRYNLVFRLQNSLYMGLLMIHYKYKDIKTMVVMNVRVTNLIKFCRIVSKNLILSGHPVIFFLPEAITRG